jgi:RNA polymerase sigma factor (sigma-70 family)
MRDDIRELVRRAQQGDRTAIGELFCRYWRAARAAAFGVTGDITSAEDAAADGFRQACAGLDSLRDPDRFGPWLRTIVIRSAQLHVRTRRNAASVDPGEMVDPRPSHEYQIERSEMALLIQHLVQALPRGLREAVSLFYFEGYDTDDAAAFLGIPPGTLRRRLHEGRRRLGYEATRISTGTKRLRAERAREIERIKAMIDQPDEDPANALYQSVRAALALRPAPPELLVDLTRGRGTLGEGSPDAFAEEVRRMAPRLLAPSARASDPTHPVAAVAAAVRRALPGFKEWRLEPGDAAAALLSFTGPRPGPSAAIVPPGLAEGRPGAWIRATRALLVPGRDGSIGTSYQAMLSCPTAEEFGSAMRRALWSDALELIWTAGAVELRSVQERLTRLADAVLPGTPLHVSAYDEPRYRTALQLRLDGALAAVGGVLGPWPGCPDGVAVAHVRLFLEPWASAREGRRVLLQRVSTIGG